MANDPKTVAIDTSAILERQRDGGGGDDFPKTVTIDSQEVAERIEAARREQGAPAGTETSSGSMGWAIPAAVVAALVLGYLVLG